MYVTYLSIYNIMYHKIAVLRVKIHLKNKIKSDTCIIRQRGKKSMTLGYFYLTIIEKPARLFCVFLLA